MFHNQRAEVQQGDGWGGKGEINRALLNGLGRTGVRSTRGTQRVGRQEEVSCQTEVRGWNACAHDQERNAGGGKERRERGGERKGRIGHRHDAAPNT